MESYSALAASYDELTQDVGYEKRAAFVEKLFLRSHIPVHTVLDLACGTGTPPLSHVFSRCSGVSDSRRSSLSIPSSRFFLTPMYDASVQAVPPRKMRKVHTSALYFHALFC